MRIFQRTAALTATVSGVPLLVFAPPARADVVYQTVALRVTQAPGTPAGTVFSSFDLPSINNAGHVTFSANVVGGGSSGDTDDLLYAGAPGSLTLVARSGDAAPGMPAGIVYAQFNQVQASSPAFFGQTLLNDNGQIAFSAEVRGTGVTSANNAVVFSGPLASLQPAAQEGSQVPGTAAGVVYSTFDVHFNESNQLGLKVTLTGSGVTTSNSNAVVIGSPGSMQLAIREGDPAPGTPPGVLLGGGGGSLGYLTFNDANQVAFWDSLSGPVNVSNRAAVFAGGVGSMQLVARNGNQASDMPAGVNYNGVSAHSTAINNAGDVAFRTFLTQTAGVTGANDSAVYAGPMSSPQIVAREGDQAPGLPAGVTYASFEDPSFNPRTPMLNDSGSVLFGGVITGPGVTGANDDVFFAGPYNDIKLIAREGQPAPGTPAGVNFVSMFSGFIGGSAIPFWSLNEADQIAVPMFLSGPGVNSSNDVALYLFDPGLGPVLIAREGSPFDVGGGVFRTIADFGIDFSANKDDDSINGLNDTGTLVFRLKFTDGSSGIFTATVPEPAGLTLLVAGTLAAALVRRRSDGQRR